jgi:hypothetical protein
MLFAREAQVLPVYFGQVRKLRTVQGVFVQQQYIWQGVNFPWPGPSHVVEEVRLQAEGQWLSCFTVAQAIPCRAVVDTIRRVGFHGRVTDCRP